MSRRPRLRSRAPVEGKKREVMIELAREALNAVLALQESNQVRRNRHDLGYEVVGYYNRDHVVRVEIVRLDRQYFFAPELPREGE